MHTSDRAWHNLSVSVLAPLVVGIVQFLSQLIYALQVDISAECRALGSVTFGITTTFNAEGASFLTLVSPPGWYWYGPDPPSSFQGSLCGALETARSEEALVGERAADSKHVHVANTASAGGELEHGSPWELTEMPSRESEDTAHDDHEDLWQPISFRCPLPGGNPRHT
jgi:hypothetical protein